VKRTLKLEQANADPQYLRDQICSAFPELSAGNVNSSVKLWQVCRKRTELSPLPVDVNNAQALFNCEQLNTACIYITIDVSINFYVSWPSGVVYNFSRVCMSVCRYLCQTVAFKSVNVGISYSHTRYISRKNGQVRI